MPKTGQAKWNAGRSAARNAAEVLPRLVAEYFKRGKKLIGSSPSLAAIHKFRILTKRLRYTLELFQPCYGPSLDRRLGTLRDMQQCLGDLNDCAMIRERVKDTALRAELDRRIERKRLEFLALWKRFDAPGSERRWTDYLSRFAR